MGKYYPDRVLKMEGNLLDIRKHPNERKYPNQNIFYVRLLEKVYTVPFIKEKDGNFNKYLYDV